MKSTHPMVNGGRSSNSLVRELSIVKMVKPLKLLVLVMVKTYSSNTKLETPTIRNSQSNMLMKLKLTESTQRVNLTKSSVSRLECHSQSTLECLVTESSKSRVVKFLSRERTVPRLKIGSSMMTRELFNPMNSQSNLSVSMQVVRTELSILRITLRNGSNLSDTSMKTLSTKEV